MRSAAITMMTRAAVLATFVLAAGPISAQPNMPVATPERAASLTVAAPAPAAIFLDVWIKSYTPPEQGQVEAVVSLAVGDNALEVGRFTFFPAGPFVAREVREERGYRFDASAALAKLGRDKPLTIRVALLAADAAKPPQGATLTLSRAAFSPRP